MHHHHTIIEQFSLQAVPFAELPGHSDSIQRLIEFSQVSTADTVLDLACGPGLVACAFAEHTAHVTGIDLTPKMIAQAEKCQRENHVTNVSWKIGNVLSLPFSDSSFSCVITRYSFHHFLDPRAVLAEMVRVCKPCGTVMVVDAVLPSEKIEAYNHMETLRDPSHTKALSFNEMATMIEKSGLRKMRTARYTVAMELEQQLAASFPNPGDEETLRHLFASDIGHDRMGLSTHRIHGAIHFSYPILMTVGEKGD